MKSSKTKFVTALALGVALAGLTQASATVLLFDFGTSAAAPSVGGTWNSIASDQASGTATGFTYATGGAATGISLAYDNFQATTTNQGNWAHGNKDWVDANATADYFWRGAGTATMTLTGLNPSWTYDIELVSARGATGNRVATITVGGLTTSEDVSSSGFNSLNDGWNNGSILRWSGVSPDVNGAIGISFTAAGSNSLFINAMQVTAIPEPSTYAALFGLLSLGCVLVIRRRKLRS
ncbi:MAG: PEP-CTERM sorting domain-containing protein [Verrucomicrobia bacterium]|nr:PEP-CTERM sorting domain-containing protein [Verrucomicrobiota bacterium]